MTRLTDGTRTIEIYMGEWTGTGYSPDWAYEFFQDGHAKYIEEEDAYLVQDIDYCIDQALDCKYGVGDYRPDNGEPVDPDKLTVIVDGEELTR